MHRNLRLRRALSIEIDFGTALSPYLQSQCWDNTDAARVYNFCVQTFLFDAHSKALCKGSTIPLHNMQEAQCTIVHPLPSCIVLV